MDRDAMQLIKSKFDANPFCGFFYIKLEEVVPRDFIFFLEQELGASQKDLDGQTVLSRLNADIFHPLWQVESIRVKEEFLIYKFRDYRLHNLLVISAPLFFLILSFVRQKGSFINSFQTPLIMFLVLMLFFWGGKMIYFKLNIKFLKMIIGDYERKKGA